MASLESTLHSGLFFFFFFFDDNSSLLTKYLVKPWNICLSQNLLQMAMTPIHLFYVCAFVKANCPYCLRQLN